VIVLVVMVGIRTGPVSWASTAWFPVIATTGRARPSLDRCVLRRQAQLGHERQIALFEVVEESERVWCVHPHIVPAGLAMPESTSSFCGLPVLSDPLQNPGYEDWVAGVVSLDVYDRVV